MALNSEVKRIIERFWGCPNLNCNILPQFDFAITGHQHIARDQSGSLLITPHRTRRELFDMSLSLLHLLLHAGFHRRFHNVPYLLIFPYRYNVN